MTQCQTHHVTEIPPRPLTIGLAAQVAPSFPPTQPSSAPREPRPSNSVHETKEKTMSVALAVEDLQDSSDNRHEPQAFRNEGRPPARCTKPIG
jgi:hypothetical protein